MKRQFSTHHRDMIRFFLLLLFVGTSVASAQEEPAKQPTPPPPTDQPAAPEKPQVVKLDENRYLIGKVTLDRRTREIRFPAKVNMDEGLLEFLLVQEKGKVHEAMLLTDASPTHINIAFMLLRYLPSNELFSQLDETGHMTGMYFDVPAEVKANARILIEVEWKDAAGKTQRKPINEWIKNTKTDVVMEPGPWLYTGSITHEGKYLPELTGDLFAIFTAPEAIVNYPGGDADSDLVWYAFSDRVPAKNTEITMIITPFPKKPAADQPSK